MKEIIKKFQEISRNIKKYLWEVLKNSKNYKEILRNIEKNISKF